MVKGNVFRGYFFEEEIKGNPFGRCFLGGGEKRNHFSGHFFEGEVKRIPF